MERAEHACRLIAFPLVDGHEPFRHHSRRSAVRDQTQTIGRSVGNTGTKGDDGPGRDARLVEFKQLLAHGRRINARHQIGLTLCADEQGLPESAKTNDGDRKRLVVVGRPGIGLVRFAEVQGAIHEAHHDPVWQPCQTLELRGRREPAERRAGFVQVLGLLFVRDARGRNRVLTLKLEQTADGPGV